MHLFNRSHLMPLWTLLMLYKSCLHASASGKPLFCEWVCASWKPCEPCLKSQWREFHRISVSDVSGFIDVMIRFYDQKVTAGSDPKTSGEYNIIITSGHVYLGLETYWLVFQVKGLKVKVTAGSDPKIGWIQYLHNFRSHVPGPGDILISFLGQKVKGQGHSRQWPKNIRWIQYHHNFRSRVPGPGDMLISFSGQKVKGQGHSRQWPKNWVNTISS